MKKIIAAALAAMLLLCGCGQNSDGENSDTEASQAESVESSIVSETVSVIDESSKESKTASSEAESSIESKPVSQEESKNSSVSKSPQSSDVKKTSKKQSSENSSVSKASEQPKVQYQTITYVIGDENDPIRQIEPEKVQQYIVEESVINTEPEPEKPVFENKYENVPQNAKADDSWFDDCVFLGDSLTVGLSMYNDAKNVFGNAEFVCASSLSYWNSQWDLYRAGNVHPYYKGNKILLEDAVRLTGAKKAIITLGMNDIGIWGPAGVLTYTRSLLDKIKAKSPDVKIYLETVSPIIYGREKTHLNNQLIREFNANLKKFAEEEGYGFLNSYDALANNYGYLPYEFCSDPNGLGLHLKFSGCEVWTDFLKSTVATAFPGDIIESSVESEEEPVSGTSEDSENNSSVDPEVTKEESVSENTSR